MELLFKNVTGYFLNVNTQLQIKIRLKCYRWQCCCIKGHVRTMDDVLIVIDRFHRLREDHGIDYLTIFPSIRVGDPPLQFIGIANEMHEVEIAGRQKF